MAFLTSVSLPAADLPREDAEYKQDPAHQSRPSPLHLYPEINKIT